MFILGVLYLLPFPTWQAIVSFTTVGRVLTYLVVGGIAVQALRITAPDLNRVFKLRAVSVLAPLASIAASLVVYWAGFGTISKLFLAAFIGLPIYFGYYAYKRLKVSLGLSLSVGLIDAIAVALSFTYLYTATRSLTKPMDLAFWTYVLVVAIVTYASIAVLYRLGTEYLRIELKAGLWLPAYMLAITILSYYGVFGLHRIIPFPWDTVIAVIVTLAFYYWAVFSAFRTKAIDQILGKSGE